MKVSRFFIACFILFIVLGVTVSANALLEDNGDGTVTQTRDDGSILMWLQDANYPLTSGYDSDGLMNWNEAYTWIDYLNSTNYAGYNDWRLPSALNSDGSGPCGLYNCSESELGYMYYTELDFPGGPILNVQASRGYWYAEESAPDPFNAWNFRLDTGFQGDGNKASSGFALAVRTVPEPISSILFITGAATLGFRRFWKKKMIKFYN